VTFAAGSAKAHVVHVHGYPAAAPRISSISSHAGPTRGGNRLTIRGSHFTKVTRVSFGPPGSRRPGTRLKVLSSTRLSVLAPADKGAGYLTVTTARGGPSALTGRALYSFLPVPAIRRLSPASGRPSGGMTVTITGTGLAFVKSVYFGSHRATHVRVLSARQIKVTAPAGTGTVSVRVRTSGGRTALVAADRFTY